MTMSPFGKRASGARLERMRGSPRYGDGVFHNTRQVAPGLKQGTAAPAISDARCLSHPNRGPVGRCRSRLLAACNTISGVMRLVCTEKPASSARSQIRLISRGIPPDNRWTSSSALGANVTAAAGRRKSRTKQGATLGPPRIDRP